LLFLVLYLISYLVIFLHSCVWMGLSVKTDGAASASAYVVDSLLKAHGSVLHSAVITKVMIDIWIGVILFLLATVWTYRARNKQTNTNVGLGVLWYRFPKFILGRTDEENIFEVPTIN